MSTRHRGRRSLAAIGLSAVIAGTAVAAPMVIDAARADTPNNPNSTTATSPTQTNVAPNGPLTGLKSGDAVSFHIHANGPSDSPAGPAGNLIFGAEARLCAAGRDITNIAEFQPSGGNCASTRLANGTNFFVQATADGAQKNVDFTFVVPTGGPQALPNDGGDIQCDFTSPCSIWIRQIVTAAPGVGDGSGNLYQHYDLNFAPPPPVAPGAPTGVNATPSNGQVGLTWTAPASDGGGAIDKYTVQYTDTTAGTPAQTQDSPATSAIVSGLTNGHVYSFGVKAHNSAGFGPLSSPLVNATPNPTGPTIVIGDASRAEGSGKFPIQSKLTLSEPQATDVLVTYTVSSADATPGVDYVQPKKPVVKKIPAGKLSTSTAITVVGDNVVEPDEHVTLTITSVTGGTGVSVLKGVGTFTIRNDDVAATPSISVGDVTVGECQAGKIPAVVGVTLSQAPAVDTTFTLTTVDGTATGAKSGGDYLPKINKTLKIKAGKVAGNFSVITTCDTQHEGDETLQVQLVGAAGYTVADGTGVITILDND